MPTLLLSNQCPRKSWGGGVGIKGDVGSFMKMGETSHDLANLVEHKNIVELGMPGRS
jgi:hypothetical protein